MADFSLLLFSLSLIIGKDYPKRIVIHEEASMKNAKRMNMIKDQLLKELHQVLYKYVYINELVGSNHEFRIYEFFKEYLL